MTKPSALLAAHKQIQSLISVFLLVFTFVYVFRIDSTSARAGGYGRLINHSRDRPNVMPRSVIALSRHTIHFYSSKRIKKGEELSYDYGDRDPVSIKHYSWLARGKSTTKAV